jgi:hypothetical protein
MMNLIQLKPMAAIYDERGVLGRESQHPAEEQSIPRKWITIPKIP